MVKYCLGVGVLTLTFEGKTKQNQNPTKTSVFTQSHRALFGGQEQV